MTKSKNRRGVTTQLLIVLAIAGAGFLAGRAGSGAESAAFGAPPQSKKEGASKSKQPKTTERAPSEAHKKLELLIGDWDAEVKMWLAPGRPPMTFKESVKRESLFDNHFVIEHVDATSDMGPYHGLAVMGYNESMKRYEMFFIDNGGTAMNLWTGTFDAAKETFSFTGNEVDMNGKKVKFRTSIDCSNKDAQIKEGFKPGKDGNEFKAFEITLTRKN